MYQVLIWDIEAQPNRQAVLGASESRPDLVGPLYKINIYCLSQQSSALAMLCFSCLSSLFAYHSFYVIK